MFIVTDSLVDPDAKSGWNNINLRNQEYAKEADDYDGELKKIRRLQEAERWGPLQSSRWHTFWQDWGGSGINTSKTGHTTITGGSRTATDSKLWQRTLPWFEPGV